MFKIFICEDNSNERKSIENAVSDAVETEHFNIETALSTDNPYKLLSYVKDDSSTGLYFLDVDLNTDINGINLAESIRKYDPRGFIVFVTTHAEMSYLTFIYKVEAMDYIIKDNCHNVNRRIHDCIMNAHKKFYLKSKEVSENFTMKVTDKVINVSLDDILFFETSDVIHKIVLHCKNRQIEFYSKMKDIEKQLDSRFYRCHRSYLINKNNIKSIDKDKRIVYMYNDEQCLVSTRLMKGLLKAAEQYVED